MSKLIITTVGTSIISNGIYDNETVINTLRNGDRPNNYNEIVNETAGKLKEAMTNNLRGLHLSAELSSLAMFKTKIGLNNDDCIVLLATDTGDGQLCAEVTKKVLDGLQWCGVQGPTKIGGFNTKSAHDFKKKGLNNLTKHIDLILNGNTWTEKYFNITGGYKGIIPFATIYAFEKDMKLIYLYEEEGSELMIIEKELNQELQQPGNQVLSDFRVKVLTCGGW